MINNNSNYVREIYIIYVSNYMRDYIYYIYLSLLLAIIYVNYYYYYIVYISHMIMLVVYLQVYMVGGTLGMSHPHISYSSCSMCI